MNDDCDPTLLAEVRKYGKFDVAGCFNCGSCTLSCELATDFASFPRRSTRQVLMGLRQVLNEGLDPWICHDCGDCSTVCPRQTEPREAMMTLRLYLASVYDWTGIASKINRSKRWHIGSLSFAAALFLLLVVLYHVYAVNMSLSDLTSTSMGLEHMFPMMTYFTLGVILFPFFILMTNAFRMYRLTVHQKGTIRSPLSQWLVEIKTFMLHFFTYKKMAECPTEKGRWVKHLLLGLGCMGMLVLLVFSLRWFQTDQIYPVYHPQRWIGYLAAAFLIFGTVDILIGRIKKEKEIHKSSDFREWNFPILLLATAVSGIAVHIFRVLGLELATHYTYAIHMMIAVPMLVIEMPFGKWTHMIYRPLALYFQSLKERTQQQESSEGVPEYVAS
jgi:quinone-modifying oxidoreductase, subunit QmoC